LLFTLHYSHMKCLCGCGRKVLSNKYKGSRFVVGHYAEFHARKNRTKTKCPVCNATLIFPPWRIRRSKTLCCSKKCMGLWNTQFRKGKKHSSWKGGISLTNGYRCVLSPSHPHANKGYVYEHRLKIEKKLDRFLSSYEYVHHIDGNKLNNRISNLQLMSRAEHARHHKLNP
jgi:hypothetical protein